MADTRRGLVLGAGGVLGASWTLGALGALEELTGLRPTSSEVIVGTSGGAVVASFLSRGVPMEQLVERHRGPNSASGTVAESAVSSPLPPSPRWSGLAGPRVLSGRRPRRIAPAAAPTALLPAGRGSLEPIADLVRTPEGSEPDWPDRPELWIVATDFLTGRRTVFGAPDAPAATVSEAVAASCAVPSWYQPSVIDGRRYVYGGASSPTSADLLASRELDEIFVIAPTASFELDTPSSALGRIERKLRRASTRRLQRETAKLRAGGARVLVLAPGPEDLAAIGANMMDARRRVDVYETALRTTRCGLHNAFEASGWSGLPAAG